MVRSPRILLIGIGVIALLALGIFLLVRTPADDSAIGPTKSYFNEKYGITFDYPEGYVLAERDLEGSGEREKHVITLIREEDSPAPTNGEGPPSISVIIVQNTLDRMTTREWVEGSADSNFKLSPDQGTAEVKVGGLDGLVYRWDGLYPGETTAVATPKWIYAISVTFDKEDDKIVRDYRAVVNSVAYER